MGQKRGELHEAIYTLVPSFVLGLGCVITKIYHSPHFQPHVKAVVGFSGIWIIATFAEFYGIHLASSFVRIPLVVSFFRNMMVMCYIRCKEEKWRFHFLSFIQFYFFKDIMKGFWIKKTNKKHIEIGSSLFKTWILTNVIERNVELFGRKILHVISGNRVLKPPLCGRRIIESLYMTNASIVDNRPKPRWNDLYAEKWKAK